MARIPQAAPPLILASASEVRRILLANAGIAAEAIAPSIDETAVKAAMREEDANAEDAALMLARIKAERVSGRYEGALVIGADQILDLDGTWFDKPTNIDEARANLLTLRGRTHGLATAVCVFRDSGQIWHHVATPRLAMRDFSERFLDEYLAGAGDGILSSVGAYRLEGMGVQLLARIEGDYFTILGLPLLQLLDFLRGHGVASA